MKHWPDFLLPTAILVILGASAFAYINTVQDTNYQTMLYPWCDTTVESCFAYCEEEECTEAEPYKKVLIETSRLEVCEDEDCDALVCTPGDLGCQVTYCSDDTIEEGEYCLDITPDQTEEGTQTEDSEEQDESSE